MHVFPNRISSLKASAVGVGEAGEALASPTLLQGQESISVYDIYSIDRLSESNYDQYRKLMHSNALILSLLY